MTFDQFVLLALLFVPLIAAVAVWCLGPAQGTLIRGLSTLASVIVLLLAGYLAISYMAIDRSKVETSGTFVPEFVPGSTTDQPHRTTWNLLPIGPGSVQFFLGVDGLNLWLVVLTAVLMLPCVLVSYTYITERVNEFYAWLLALQTCMIGVFLAFDIVLFYVFFEISLVPLFFLIGIWGGSQRQYAAKKFVIFTLTGSLITLLGVLGVVMACYSFTETLTFSIPELITLVQSQVSSPKEETRQWWASAQVWLFLSLSLGFAIKVPLMPFHTWLPLAHTEAPTAGSVDLAGVLLKIGSYAFLRLCIPLAPDVSLSLGLPLITWLSAIGVVYGAFCAFAQDDIKKLIAYSSVSHLGLCMLGMFSLTVAGIQGSIMQMINHGLSTAGLFLLVGMLYERYHTRRLGDYSGMANKLPLFATLFVFIGFSSVGLPGLNGFVGEFLCLAGIFEYEWNYTSRILLTVLGASGMLLGAWYLFTMIRKVLFGELAEPHHDGHEVKDLSPREWGLMIPICLLCVVIGVYPAPILKTTEPDVERVAKITDGARTRAGLPTLKQMAEGKEGKKVAAK